MSKFYKFITIFLLFILATCDLAFSASDGSIGLAQQLYISYYGRPADPAGQSYWAGVFDETDDLAAALSAFGTSEEYTNNFGSMTNEELVSNLYQQLFGRDPESGGLEFYAERLSSGQSSLATIAKQIADGASGDDLIAMENKITVANTYTSAVSELDAAYDSDDIEDARNILAAVDNTEDSVKKGNTAAVDEVTSNSDNGNGGSEPQSYNIADYFPLTTGYVWIYCVTNSDHDFLRRECGSAQQFNGENVIPIGYMYSYDNAGSYDPWSTADFNYFTLDDRGLLWQGCNDISDSGEDEILMPKTPVTITSRTFNIGDSWTNSLQVEDGKESITLTVYFEVMAAGETITVDAGTYTDTIKLYESTSGEGKRYLWLARNIGIVKVESINDSDSGILAMGDSALIEAQIYE